MSDDQEIPFGLSLNPRGTSSPHGYADRLNLGIRSTIRPVSGTPKNAADFQPAAELRRYDLTPLKLEAPKLDVRGTNFKRLQGEMQDMREKKRTAAFEGIKKGRNSKAFKAQAAHDSRHYQKEIGEAFSNKGRISKAVPFLDKWRGNIPRYFLLGWLDLESSGILNSEERLKHLNDPSYVKDEVGWFQISVEERKEILHLKDVDRTKILTDPDFSARQGVRLIQSYEKKVRDSYGFSEQSPAYWEMVKLLHQVGNYRAGTLSKAVSAEGLLLPELSWEDIKSFVATHRITGLPLATLSRIDFLVIRGKVLENSIETDSKTK